MTNHTSAISEYRTGVKRMRHRTDGRRSQHPLRERLAGVVAPKRVLLKAHLVRLGASTKEGLPCGLEL